MSVPSTCDQVPPSQTGGMFDVDGLPSTGPYGASHGAPKAAISTTTRNTADSMPGLSARSSANSPVLAARIS